MESKLICEYCKQEIHVQRFHVVIESYACFHFECIQHILQDFVTENRRREQWINRMAEINPKNKEYLDDAKKESERSSE